MDMLTGLEHHIAQVARSGSVDPGTFKVESGAVAGGQGELEQGMAFGRLVGIAGQLGDHYAVALLDDGDLAMGHGEVVLGGFVVCPGSDALGLELLLALVFEGEIAHQFRRRDQLHLAFEVMGAERCNVLQHIDERGVGSRQFDLERCPVNFKQQLGGLDKLIVDHRDRADPAVDLRTDADDFSFDVGVLRGHVAAAGGIEIDRAGAHHQGNGDQQNAAYEVS